MIKRLSTPLVAVFIVAGLVPHAFAGVVTYYNQAAFNSAAGATTAEGFETIRWDSWIYHTRLPSPIHALDLDDNPADPNDGPDYDLDGHFRITGNSIAYAPANELFKVIRSAGNQHLSFSPWYNILWPKTFDPNNQHPIITFDNFNNNDDPITAFGLTFVDYTPNPNRWLVMELGNEFVPLSFNGPRGDYFVGFVSNSPFSQVQLHTNQNGASVRIDDLSFRPAATPVPEPAAMLSWLALLGLTGLGYARRRRKRLSAV